MFKVSTIRTTGEQQEMTLEELHHHRQADDVMSEQQSHRSFDFEEPTEHFEVVSDEGGGGGGGVVNEEEFKRLRDADDEDFPSAEALRMVPTKLIENNALVYKGRKLMRLLSIFYNTTCKICTSVKRFKTVNGLFEHYRGCHGDVEPFVTCCSMELKKMPKIIWHFVKHIEPEAFKCRQCDYVVSRPKFLRIHEQTHLPEGEKPLECDL
jgi:hypothetical protein